MPGIDVYIFDSPGMRPSMRIQETTKKVIKFVFDDQDLNKSR